MKEFLLEVLLPFAALLIPGLLIILGVSDCSSRYGCEATAQAMRLNHRYEFVTGCLIEARAGQWVPLSAYRVID